MGGGVLGEGAAEDEARRRERRERRGEVDIAGKKNLTTVSLEHLGRGRTRQGWRDGCGAKWQ